MSFDITLKTYTFSVLKVEFMTSPTKDLRIEVDVSASNNWVELDAIQLQGNK